MSEDTVQMLLSLTFSFLPSADFITNFFSGVTFFFFFGHLGKTTGPPDRPGDSLMTTCVFRDRLEKQNLGV